MLNMVYLYKKKLFSVLDGRIGCLLAADHHSGDKMEQGSEATQEGADT